MDEDGKKDYVGDMIFNADTGKPLGMVENTYKVDSLNITTGGKPKVDSYRETRIEYTEMLGDSYKSCEIDTYMTFKELRKLLREVLANE